jgi:enoyl-CoA hydratase/carnithine racemase
MSVAESHAAEETILVERDGPVATVVLNRPHKLNALTKPMWARLGEVLRELDADESLRCVVLRGAGEKAFSPGNDISEFETERANPEQAKDYGRLMHGTLMALRELRHPSVARIHGICVGGGMEIAGLCDLRICGEGSRFGAPIAKLGLVMAYPEIQALRDLVGKQTALEILLEGRVFDAAEAKEKGIVTRIVPDGEVAEEVATTARRVAEGAPLVARWHKKFLRRLEDPRPLSEGEFDEGFACYGTKDFAIGYKAFLEKTKPEFEGR